ncbi:MAG TPA: tetraacyldisaccharide 4'-kinase [Alphaproteobacteria bacterium]|nr:tetraacyldisaccharide 4'-kinase [Alphaproteobacteria bacterium]
MRAPAFWYHRAALKAGLLSPFSLVFCVGGLLRRAFAKPYEAKIPVICVGNIVAGGAGKTPTALALAELLKQNGAKPVFVTRGYGGSEAGPLEVQSHHTASQVGDEALLLTRAAPTIVGRDRAAAVKLAESKGTHIILDDGLQNPHVKPTVSFLVIDGEIGLGNGHIIPAGPLRETLNCAEKRVAAIIIIGSRDNQDIASRATVPVLHAHLKSNLPANFPQDEKFYAFAGIARPEKFFKSCAKSCITLAGTQEFDDHHEFSDDELAELENTAATQGARLLTTEKDWVRLPPTMREKVVTLPVRLSFDEPDAVKQYLSI